MQASSKNYQFILQRKRKRTWKETPLALASAGGVQISLTSNGLLGFQNEQFCNEQSYGDKYRQAQERRIAFRLKK